MENITNLKPDYSMAMDFRPTIAHVCCCGSNMFRVICMFEDYEISMYFLDMECINCGSLYNAPTPIDNPDEL